MPGKNNPGQFGNRPDTEKQAKAGGKASPMSFKPGDPRASKLGKQGAEAQPTEAKREGGRHSHDNS